MRRFYRPKRLRLLTVVRAESLTSKNETDGSLADMLSE